MKRNILISGILASITLFLGGIIYVLFRPQYLLMFDWIEAIGLTESISRIRENSNANLPDWIIYALPDALWTFSYLLCIGCIWKFDVRRCLPALLILPTVSVVDEILQSLNMVPGTFDLMDIIAYSISSLIGIVYLRFIRQYSNKKLAL